MELPMRCLGTDKTDPDTDLTINGRPHPGWNGYSDFAEVDANTNPLVAHYDSEIEPPEHIFHRLQNQPLEWLDFSATDPDANQSLTLSIVPGVSLFFLIDSGHYEASPNVRATDDYNASISSLLWKAKSINWVVWYDQMTDGW